MKDGEVTTFTEHAYEEPTSFTVNIISGINGENKKGIHYVYSSMEAYKRGELPSNISVRLDDGKKQSFVFIEGQYVEANGDQHGETGDSKKPGSYGYAKLMDLISQNGLTTTLSDRMQTAIKTGNLQIPSNIQEIQGKAVKKLQQTRDAGMIK